MTLKELRFNRRITQIELSQLSGVNQATLSHIENFIIRPSERHKKAIGTALQLDPGAIDWGEQK